jgi:hypothetical protein
MGSILRNTLTGMCSFFRFDGVFAGLLPNICLISSQRTAAVPY